jgi:hypothetical protein
MRLLLAIAVSTVPAALGAFAGDEPSTNWTERYVLETVVAGDATSTRVERVTMEFQPDGDRLETRYRSDHKGGCDDIVIWSGSDGSAIAAVKRELGHSGRKLANARIWLQDEAVHVEQTFSDGNQRVRKRDREDLPIAADASLLAFLRFFPFGEGRALSVLIATFAQHFVVMQIRQVGTEAITVPAGRFDCYRLEGVVDLIVIEMRTVFWVTREAPHFLVRYEGRRGLFWTPTYVTSLVSKEVRIPPATEQP